MTYLTKTKDTEHEIEYSYGKKENDYIGSVSFDKNTKTITEESLKLSYYGENSFCRATVNAIKAISHFIEENNYPEKYLRATH